MINNEHNPIAVRISNVQDLWIENRQKTPDAKVYCLLCDASDYQIVESFVRLEASQYGVSADIITGFRTNFESKKSFYRSLISEWLETFSKESKENPEWNWTGLRNCKEATLSMDSLTEEELKQLFVNIVISFKEFIGDDNWLGIALFITSISDYYLLEETLQEMAESLPVGCGLLLIDYRQRNLFDSLCRDLREKACVIDIPSQDMAGAYKEIATQGNPQDPNVKYRKCLFELGESAQKGHREETKRKGSELFRLSREIGGLPLIASSYLIAAGFLIRFHKEKDHCIELLDKGISMVRPRYLDEAECAQILLQLMNYKGAVYSFNKELGNATDEFVNAVKIAREANMPVEAVNEYNYALLIALRRDRMYYLPILEDAFKFSYSLPDETLRIVNISFIMATYLKKGNNLSYSEQEEIENRMATLYGEDWQLTTKELAKKLEKEFSLKK